MGIGDLLGEAWDTGKKVVGETVDGSAHVAGAGLDLVGLDGAAKKVDGWGDSAADSLGVEIPEKELGDTDDPKELLHGDPARIRKAAAHLRNFHAAFESTGSGLQRLDHDHWQGDAGNAFRAKFTPHAKQWLTAADACQEAADALETYAHMVLWAQGRAKHCLDRYTKASDAYQRAQAAYSNQVAAYNAQAATYDLAVAAGLDPGSAPTKPGKFDGDHYGAEMAQAESDLHDAREQRDSAARTAAQAIEVATNTAPREPSFMSRLVADGEDLTTGSSLATGHVVGGVVKGAADMLKFARGLNPMDPYNMTHPAMWLDQVNTTAAGLLHASNHPTEMVSAMVGSGWGSDPGEAFGKLIANVASGVLTDGASAEASVAEREAVGVAENAAKDEAENVAEHGAANSGSALPDGWTIDPTTADKEAHHEWGHLAQSTDHVSAKAIHYDVTDPETQARFLDDQYPWLKDVNGNRYWDNVPGYNQNCSKNVEAIDGRLDGHDSVAEPLHKPAWPSQEKLGNPNAEWQHNTSYDSIIDDMDKRGVGSRGVVYVSRPDGTAHVFNVVHDRNGVVFLDGQTGKLGTLEKDVTEVRYMPYK